MTAFSPGRFLRLSLLACCVVSQVLGAMTPEVAYTFPKSEWLTATGPLVRDAGGAIFGCTTRGGDNGHGFVFRISPDRVVSVVHSIADPGELLPGSLTRTRGGNLLGAGNRGIVRLTDEGTPVVLARFTDVTGSVFSAPLVETEDGALYGVTTLGARSGCGAFVKLTPAGTWSVLADRDCEELGGRISGLAPAGDGSFMGTSSQGGSHGLGCVFRLSADGLVTIVVSFGGALGVGPIGGVIRASDGQWYGTTSGIDFEDETARSQGTVFRLTAEGSLSTLYAFSHAPGAGAQGAYPRSPLVEGNDGNLYGTTSDVDADGDSTGRGSVFRVSLAGDIKTVFSDSLREIAAWMPGPLSAGGDGHLYCLARFGRFGAGIILRIPEEGTATEYVSFPHLQGLTPRVVLETPDGGFLVATDSGGTTGDGTLLRVEADGRSGSIHSFGPTTGSVPSSLIANGDGSYLGTTRYGGAHGAGTVFRFFEGLFGPVHSFAPNLEGRSPLGLIRTRTGRIFGLTSGEIDGSTGDGMEKGSVFEWHPDGTVTTRVRFADTVGRRPVKLVEGPDGTLFGITANGGWKDVGTLFAMNTDGQLTTLHEFGDEGELPNALVVGENGDVYGTAYGGGRRAGLVFRFRVSGGFEVLHEFPAWGSEMTGEGEGGAFPSDLYLTRAGRIFGLTNGGGAFGEGVLFEVRTDGSVTTHVSFARSNPLSAITEGAEGNLYFISSRPELIRLLPGVALRIVRSFPGLALSWPFEAEGYTLQSTERLQPPVWKTVISPQPWRGYAMWTNAGGLEGRFFRLVRDE